MSRRLVLVAALVLIGTLSTGCADDVAPAARVGDATEISDDALFAEVDEWASSPTLLEQLGATTEGAGEGSFSTLFVNLLLTNRIRFELHNAQFDELGLVLTDEEVAAMRTGLLADPATTAAVLEELSPEYGERLVADAARQLAVSQAMADDYAAWATGAFTTTDIDISPRYGSWDSAAGQVVPPSGPRPAPVTETSFEL